MRARYSLSVNIKASDMSHVLIKKDCIIDYDSEKRLYKTESVKDEFCDQLKEIGVTDFTVETYSTTGLPVLVSLTIDDGIITISSLDDDSENIIIYYRLYQEIDSIRIHIENGSSEFTHRLTVIDGIKKAYDFKDDIVYKYSGKVFSLTIDRLFNGICVSSVNRDIIINDIFSGATNIEKPLEQRKENTTPSDIFKSGTEDRNLNAKSEIKSNSIPFSLDVALLTKDAVEEVEIYPKVKATYSVNARYNTTKATLVGAFSYNATISRGSKAIISIHKYYAGTLNVRFSIEAMAKYKDGQSYKTKAIKKDISLSVNLMSHTTFNHSTKSAMCDVLSVCASLERLLPSSVNSIMYSAASATISESFDLYNYKITNVSSLVDGTSVGIARAYFQTNGNDIAKGSCIKYIVAPFKGVFTSHNIVSTNEITTRTKVVSKAYIDGLSMSDQSGGTSTSSAYKVIIKELTNSDSAGSSGHVQITEGEVYLSPVADIHVNGSVSLSDSSPSDFVNISKHMSAGSGVVEKATVIAKATKDVYINDVLVKAGSSRTFYLEGTDEGLYLCARSTSINIIVPNSVAASGEISCNGIESTYLTENKGKENTSSGAIPLHIPNFATSINISAALNNIIPNSARSSTTFTSSKSNNIDQSCIVNLSSNYKGSMDKSVESTLAYTSKKSGYSLNKDTRRVYYPTINVTTPGTYAVNITTGNPSISLEYPRVLKAVTGINTITVVAYCTTSKYSKWNVLCDPFYLYEKDTELFTYDNKTKITSKNGCAVIPLTNDYISPICVIRDGANLTRVVYDSLESRTISETYSGNAFYTMYKDIYDVRLLSHGKEYSRFTVSGTSIITEENDTYTVIYKVLNSFDYKCENGLISIATDRDNPCIIEVYKEEGQLLCVEDINPSNTFIDEGYVYIDTLKHTLTDILVEEFNTLDAYLYYITLKDEDDNPFIDNITLKSSGKSLVFDNNLCGVLCINTKLAMQSVTVKTDALEITIGRGDFLCI